MAEQGAHEGPRGGDCGVWWGRAKRLDEGDHGARPGAALDAVHQRAQVAIVAGRVGQHRGDGLVVILGREEGGHGDRAIQEYIFVQHGRSAWQAVNELAQVITILLAHGMVRHK